MIVVSFKSKSGNIIKFTVKGHAEYAEYGSDIVCSAVSALAQTTIMGVTDVLNIDADYQADEGNIVLDIEKVSTSDMDECQVLMKTMKLGIKSIENSYGKYIKLVEEEV